MSSLYLQSEAKKCLTSSHHAQAWCRVPTRIYKTMLFVKRALSMLANVHIKKFYKIEIKELCNTHCVINSLRNNIHITQNAFEISIQDSYIVLDIEKKSVITNEIRNFALNTGLLSTTSHYITKHILSIMTAMTSNINFWRHTVMFR